MYVYVCVIICDWAWENRSYPQNTLVYIMARIFRSVFAIQDLLVLFNAKQKHLGCIKRRGQSEAAVI